MAAKTDSAVVAAPSLATTLPELRAALGDGVMSHTELLTRATPAAISAGWAAGEIEFGRRTHILTGPCASGTRFVLNDSGTMVRAKDKRAFKPGSTLLVEGGQVEWTGPKARHHKPYSELAVEPLPLAEQCQKYVTADEDSDEATLKRVPITRAEAEQLLELQVRLTEKGMSKFTESVA